MMNWNKCENSIFRVEDIENLVSICGVRKQRVRNTNVREMDFISFALHKTEERVPGWFRHIGDRLVKQCIQNKITHNSIPAGPNVLSSFLFDRVGTSATNRNTLIMLAPATTRDFSLWLKKLQYMDNSTPKAGWVILHKLYIANL